MKRNVIISGEFSLTEVKNVENKQTKPKTAAARIAALKAAGIDTSSYFPLGEEMVVKVVDGIPVQVTDDDPIYNKLQNGGYIGHYKLFRRWVMAQMFHMLRQMETSSDNFNEILQRKGYEYQWRMLENELYAQMKMDKHGDRTCLGQRVQWFNKDVAADMIYDYITKLQKYITDNLMYRLNRKGQKVYLHKCKGLPYVRIGNKNIFVADLEAKVYRPLADIAFKLTRNIPVKETYELVRKFNRTHKKLLASTKQSYDFINAYKGSGAYFTMRNLVMFHGARFLGMNETQSLSHIERKADAYKEEGWRMMGVLKQLISDSGISIQGKIDEWK